MSDEDGPSGPVGTWTTLPSGGPSARARGTAVWTGNAGLIWGGDGTGGSLNDGALYDPDALTWTITADSPYTGGRTDLYHCKQNYTGRYLAFWGGRSVTGGSYYETDSVFSIESSGALYDTQTDQWIALGTPDGTDWGGRAYIHCIYDEDNEVYYFIGGSSEYKTGAGIESTTVKGDPLSFQVFDPGNLSTSGDDAWTDQSSESPLVHRKHAAVVWTGSEVIIWGGMYDEDTYYTDGAVYNPDDGWRTMSTAPISARRFTAHTWTGNEMIVWGGLRDGDEPAFFNDGAMYDPISNSWAEMGTSKAPGARAYIGQTLWTGTHMAVYGGMQLSVASGSIELEPQTGGGLFSPALNEWERLDWSDVLADEGIGGAHLIYDPSGRILIWGGMTGTTEFSSQGAALQLGGDYFAAQ